VSSSRKGISTESTVRACTKSLLGRCPTVGGNKDRVEETTNGDDL